jgi:hypothetical protein
MENKTNILNAYTQQKKCQNSTNEYNNINYLSPPSQNKFITDIHQQTKPIIKRKNINSKTINKNHNNEKTIELEKKQKREEEKKILEAKRKEEDNKGEDETKKRQEEIKIQEGKKWLEAKKIDQERKKPEEKKKIMKKLKTEKKK